MGQRHVIIAEDRIVALSCVDQIPAPLVVLAAVETAFDVIVSGAGHDVIPSLSGFDPVGIPQAVDGFGARKIGKDDVMTASGDDVLAGRVGFHRRIRTIPIQHVVAIGLGRVGDDVVAQIVKRGLNAVRGRVAVEILAVPENLRWRLRRRALLHEMNVEIAVLPVLQHQAAAGRIVDGDQKVRSIEVIGKPAVGALPLRIRELHRGIGNDRVDVVRKQPRVVVIAQYPASVSVEDRVCAIVAVDPRLGGTVHVGIQPRAAFQVIVSAAAVENVGTTRAVEAVSGVIAAGERLGIVATEDEAARVGRGQHLPALSDLGADFDRDSGAQILKVQVVRSRDQFAVLGIRKVLPAQKLGAVFDPLLRKVAFISLGIVEVEFAVGVMQRLIIDTCHRERIERHERVAVGDG